MPFADKLLEWYDQHGRQELPWRYSITAYRVWLSEIMLQQTQVKTVINYFNRFIETFPSIIDLANASEDEVLHLWSGLGYYSRARNLHKTAKIIQKDFQGNFPKDLALLETLPGIGRSTAAAIYSISFNQPAAILDGNVKRILSRYYNIQGWPGTPENLNRLWKQAENLVPRQRAADYSQAIMDLGAMICIRKQPKCLLCPVQKNCTAFQKQLTHVIPASKPKTKKPCKSTYMLILKNQHSHILLEKRPPVGIWGSLWCLPICELDQDFEFYCKTEFGLAVNAIKSLPAFRHTFSHYHLDIHPIILSYRYQRNSLSDDKLLLWYDVKNPTKLGLAAPVQRLLKELTYE